MKQNAEEFEKRFSEDAEKPHEDIKKVLVDDQPMRLQNLYLHLLHCLCSYRLLQKVSEEEPFRSHAHFCFIAVSGGTLEFFTKVSAIAEYCLHCISLYETSLAQGVQIVYIFHVQRFCSNQHII